MMDSKPNFTPRAKETIKLARKEALLLNSREVGLDHLILALLSSRQSLIVDLFSKMNIPLEDFKEFIIDHLTSSLAAHKEKVSDCKFSLKFNKILNLSNSFAEELGHEYIGNEHIFYVLLVQRESPLRKYLSDLAVTPEACAIMLKSFFALGDLSSYRDPEISDSPALVQPNKTETALQTFAKNYNEMAREGKFDKVICKESEIQKISEILCRRNKNNPILIGLPGTGKTSLVEGLTQTIVGGTSPDLLSNKVIYEIDLAGMIAGTKYRGQFEKRLKSLIDEVSADPNIILFIDEIHTLIGAGSAEGTMDAANILKPALAKGDLKCIGASTPKECAKTIMKDGALSRRFQEVRIEEPSASEALTMVQGIIEQYEDFHHVRYRKNTHKLAVDLSCRYINDRQLPDKAIDIIDQAGAKVKMKNFAKPAGARKIEKEIEVLMLEEDLSKNKLLYKKKKDKLVEKYQKMIQSWAVEYEKTKFYVTQNDIFEVVSSLTGIPITNLSKKESKMLLNLESKLKEEISYQDKAVSSLCSSILRSKSGLRDTNRPIGSFLFLGRSGVGKTHTAKVLAEKFFGSDKNLIQVDMTEYSEKINVSRLTGSAPGYIGYEDGGQLTDKIKNKPYSILLFDEIEKAHPDVVQVLLQVLEEGRLTDSSGRASNFRNSIIIMTGNIGASFLDKGTSVGFGGTQDNHDDKIFSEAKKALGVEFINRIDEVIVFEDFTESNIKSMLKKEISKLKKKVLEDHGISLSIENSAIDNLTQKAHGEKMGARPIRKLMQRYIETIVSREIIKKTTKRIQIKESDLS